MSRRNYGLEIKTRDKEVYESLLKIVKRIERERKDNTQYQYGVEIRTLNVVVYEEILNLCRELKGKGIGDYKDISRVDKDNNIEMHNFKGTWVMKTNNRV